TPMSTALSAPDPAPANVISRPLPSLLDILVLGHALRAMHPKDSVFQVEEFTALAAVPERQGTAPVEPAGVAPAFTAATHYPLVAALFAALDPIQIASSWLARPYALGNLATVLSFASLWGVLQARKPVCGTLHAIGYGLCLAAIGYFNALMLFVVAAHLGMVIF